jgi:hypothetical protein
MFHVATPAEEEERKKDEEKISLKVIGARASARLASAAEAPAPAHITLLRKSLFERSITTTTAPHLTGLPPALFTF